MASLPGSETVVTEAPLDPQSRYHATLRAAGRVIARRLTNHNPFYVISAALVFWGLNRSFDLSRGDWHVWALIGSLAGYTLLLAVAAVAVVRLGKIQVWDDARSLVLLVVLLFVALSIMFDELLIEQPAVGTWYFTAGGLFAAGVCESVLRAMRIRLVTSVRIPFHLLLATFYLYPLALSPLLGLRTWHAACWLVLFATVIAGSTLLLLPAVRQGTKLADISGTPWISPWYPWSVFVVLWFAAAARAVYLCVSFDSASGDASIFAWYFLVPLALAVNVLWLEGTLQQTNRRWTQAALLAPLGALFLASTQSLAIDPRAAQFLAMITDAGHTTPLHLTLWAVIVFYSVALWRRVSWSAELWALAVTLLVFIAPHTESLSGPFEPRGWPLVLVAIQQFVLIVQPSQRALRVAAGVAACMLAGAIDLRGKVAGYDEVATGLALFVLAAMVSAHKAGGLRSRTASQRDHAM